MRNQLYFICIVFVISFAFTINTVQAERNVKDCLETDEDCLEIEEEGLVEDNLIEQNETASSNQTGSLIVNMLKIVFALALVLILIYVLLLFLKKKNKLSSNSQTLETLGGISVGQQKSIQVVRIGNKVYAVGVGNDVTMLDEITDQEVIEQFEESKDAEPQAITFIQNWLQKRSNKENAQKSSLQNQSFSKTLEEELEELRTNREQLIKMNQKDDDMNG